MFNFLRNLTKSAAEKRREQLNAYVDGALSPAEQRRFEAQLQADDDLRQELAQLRTVKQALGGLPRVRAPRNFTLDPAAYPRPAPPLSLRFYPVLRTATAMAAVFFVLLLGVGLLQTGGGLVALAPEEEMAADTVEMSPAAAEMEALAVEESAPMAEDAAAAEAFVEGEREADAPAAAEMAVEEVVEEAEMADEAADEAADDDGGDAAEEPPATATPSPTVGRDVGGGVSATEPAPETATPEPTATPTTPATATPLPTATPPPTEAAPPPPATATPGAPVVPPATPEPAGGLGLPTIPGALLFGGLLALAGAALAALLVATLLIRRRLP